MQGIRADQFAFYAADDHAAQEIKIDLRLDKSSWVKDIATGEAKVALGNDEVLQGVSVAKLEFNYELGIEIEILRYLSGPHWHMRNHGRKFVSHIGIHLDDNEPFPLMPYSRCVQEMKTISHTNVYLTDPKSPGFNRRYHYRIHELGPSSYIKYIRRIMPEAT